MLTEKNRMLIGSVIAFTSAVSFSLNVVLAGVGYNHGANVHATNLCRAALFLTCLLTVVVVKNKSLAMPSKARLGCFLIGILLCTEMFVLLGAIRTIPVALAILIFFTYPILIATFGWIRRFDTFSLPAFLLMMVAFSGLVIVLIDAPVDLDFTGVMFAIFAAVVMATMLIFSETSLSRYDNIVVLVQALAAVTIIMIVLSIAAIELTWPTGGIGWTAFFTGTIFYVVATFCLFTAVSIIGPLKMAIIDNTAPVWAIGFGYLLLDQTFSGLQLIGAAVVVISVMCLQVLHRA